MFGLPPATSLLFGLHALVGAACLFFGLRLKRSFRWVLLIVAAIEAIGLGIVAMGIVGAPH